MVSSDDQSVTDTNSQEEGSIHKKKEPEKIHDLEANAAPALSDDVECNVKEDLPKPTLPFDSSQYPDGGRDAWLCVAGSAACYFCSFGWMNAVGVFQDYYATVTLSQYSASTVGWIVSTEVFLMASMLTWVGLWYDNFGPRWLLIIGTILHVFGLMMTSLATEYYQIFLAQGVCSALGAAMIFGPGMSCTQTWFWEKRGIATGLSAAGSGLGGIIFPIVVGRMIKKTGFPWAIRTCAFIVLALMIFANCTVKPRIPPKKRKFEWAAFVRPLKETPFLLMCISCFFAYWGVFIPIAFIVTTAAGHGMSVELAQYLVCILNAGSIFGRTLPGLLGDRFGRFNTLTVFYTLTAILTLAMWIPAESNTVYILFAAFFGFSSGAVMGLAPACIAQISPIQEIGTRIGAAFSCGGMAALTGTPIGGALIGTSNRNFLYMQLFSGLASAVSVIFLVGSRISLVGWAITKKV